MRSLLADRRQTLAALAIVALTLLVAARLLLHAGAASQPQTLVRAPVEVARAGAAASAAVVVDVAGAVRSPGLYRLARGGRIADAVARAGGATAKANLALVNLAAPLADGEQVVVPAAGAAAPAVGAIATPAGAAQTGPVHLNTATVEQLDALPGVGPVTAQKIVEYRQQHGAFTSVAELDAIPGIGPRRIDELKGLVVP